jgi:hypothetical protein
MGQSMTANRFKYEKRILFKDLIFVRKFEKKAYLPSFSLAKGLKEN